MANHVQSARQSERSADAELTLAELMDPVALEARLAAARARRAEALARRREETADPTAVAVTRVPRRGAPEGSAPADPAPTPLSPRATIRPEAAPGPAPVSRRPTAPIEEARAAAPLPPRAAARLDQGQAPVPLPPSMATRPEAPRGPAPILAAGSPVVRRPVVSKPAARPLPTVETAVRQRPALGSVPAVLLAVLVGLVGGGAAVLLAPPAFRQHIADRIAPQGDRAMPAPAGDSQPAVQSAAPAVPATDRAEREPAPASGPIAQPAAAIPTAPVRAEADMPPLPVALVNPPPAAESEAPALGSVLLAARAPSFDAANPATHPPFVPQLLVPAAPEARQPAIDEPARPAEAPAVAPERVPAPPPRAQPAIASAPAPAAPVPVAASRIYVHYPPSAASAAVVAVDALRAAGVQEARPMQVSFPVANTDIRYFHPEDRATAEQLARTIGGTDATIRDFTSYRPQPPNGVLEIWFGGTMATDPDAPQPQAAPAPAPKVARQGTGTRQGTSRPRESPADLAAQQARTDAVQQIVVRRAVERMLREQLGN